MAELSKGSWRFRQKEISRAIRAAQAAGIEVERVEVQDGKIVVISRDKTKPAEQRDATWDDLRNRK